MSGDEGSGSMVGSMMALTAYGAIDATMGNTTMKRIKTYNQ